MTARKSFHASDRFMMPDNAIINEIVFRLSQCVVAEEEAAGGQCPPLQDLRHLAKSPFAKMGKMSAFRLVGLV